MNKTHYFDKLTDVSNLGAKFNHRIALLQGLVDCIMRMQDDNLYEHVHNLCADLLELHSNTLIAVGDELNKPTHNNDDASLPTTNNE